MSRSTSGIPTTSDDAGRLCQSCGLIVDQPIDGRCTRCGERLPTGDVTSDDLTPYAVALANGRRGWMSMLRWVCWANRQRLMHLGLLRPSPASRRFARLNTLLLSAMIALAIFGNAGWHIVRQGPATIVGRAEPVGKGWWRAAENISTIKRDGDVVAIWWNLPWATLLAVSVFVVSAIVLSILIAWVGRGAERSLRGELRGEMRGAPRLRCAVHYSTAWLPWVALGTLPVVIAPLRFLLEATANRVVSLAVFQVPAVLVIVGASLLWWFWTIRLGQTTPRSTRAATTRYFSIWAPLTIVIVLGAVVYGVWIGSPMLAERLNLIW